MSVDEIIRDIRKRCRLAMNGVVSTSMRERGVSYKLNFGVSLAQIKAISTNYKPSKKLAEKLWIEDVRELKILATLLYPVEEFDDETANHWMKQISNQEIREQICINLFQKLDFADKLVQSWVTSDTVNARITGYWLLVRLLLLKNTAADRKIESYPSIFKDVKCEDTFLRNSALQALKYIGRSSASEAGLIMDSICSFKDSEDSLEKEIYESLKFEFDFYFE